MAKGKKSLSSEEYLAFLEANDRKLEVKKNLCSNSFEVRMIADRQAKVQHMIKKLKRILCRNADGVKVETADDIERNRRGK